MTSKTLLFVLICFTTLLLTACGGSNPEPEISAEQAWRLSAAPASAASIIQTKTNAQAGDTVTLTGVVGGNVEGGITAESGLFLMVDHQILSCADMGDDHCPTPWDYCCEPRDSLTNAMATILIVDNAGNPLNLDGLQPLDEVVITGTVGPRPEPAVLTVTAQGVYVEPADAASGS